MKIAVLISLTASAQSTFVNRYLSIIFKLKKRTVPVKNPDAYFVLKISANQDLESILYAMLGNFNEALMIRIQP